MVLLAAGLDPGQDHQVRLPVSPFRRTICTHHRRPACAKKRSDSRSDGNAFIERVGGAGQVVPACRAVVRDPQHVPPATWHLLCRPGVVPPAVTAASCTDWSVRCGCVQLSVVKRTEANVATAKFYGFHVGPDHQWLEVNLLPPKPTSRAASSCASTDTPGLHLLPSSRLHRDNRPGSDPDARRVGNARLNCGMTSHCHCCNTCVMFST